MKLVRIILTLAAALWLAACAQATPEATPTSPPPTTAAPPPTEPPTATTAPTETTAATPTGLAATETPGSAATDAPTARSVPSDTPLPAASPTRSPFVTYRDFEIVPPQATVALGTTVVFLIQSESGVFHQPYTPGFAAPGPNDFEAPANLGNGSSYQFTFTQPGTVTILCGYHASMQASIVVGP